MPVVSLEGNIFCGKTTYLKRLESEGYLVHYNETLEQSDLAHKFYNDTKRYSLGYHLQLLHQFCPRENHGLHIYENSPYTLKAIHCELLHSKRHFDEDEYKIYENYHNTHGWLPDVMIYLYCHPKVCYDRCMTQHPSNPVNLDYLTEIHTRYEIVCDELNSPVKMYKVNTQETPETVYQCLKQILGTLEKE
uniref:Deoxynucleoside kinase domain-containing protein n=1 Tax=viral metagenome TaxID=1070528 RepID=A0A6C0BK62_9ZZZZ